MRKSAYIRLAAIAFAAAASLTSLSSCQKEVPDSLEASAAESSLSSFGGSTQLTIKANNPVTISSDASWLTTHRSSWTPTDSEQQVSVTVSAARNQETAARKATLTLSAGSLTKTLSFSQDEKGQIIADKSAVYEIEGEGGEVVVTISTNLDCEVATDAKWLTLSVTKGLTDKKYSFKAEENNSISDRTATVTFSYKDVAESVEITQKGVFSLVSFDTQAGTACAPIFDQKIDHGKIDWGDSQTSTYSSQATHNYTDDAESHTVTAKVDPSTRATISGIIGITKINFSEL